MVNHKSNGLIYRLSLLAVILAFVVVMLGAYTRLVDAGLGCPDWPACYGHLTVPETQTEIQQAEQAYPERPVEAAKAWTEMVHRYLASTLGFLILLISILSVRCKFQDNRQRVLLPLTLLAVVIFQGLLGMWTVTLLLQPTIVMGHLLGGLTTLSLLWFLMLRLGAYFTDRKMGNELAGFRFWGFLGLFLLAVQIFLGGWTSANYAGVSCPDFPYCQGQLFPHADMKQAFNLWPSVGPDYQGGLLSNAARMTINTVHRFLGVIVGVYLSVFALCLAAKTTKPAIRAWAIWVLLVVIAQVLLGILNVVLNLPLSLAVAHNGVAALLLVSLITVIYSLYPRARSFKHHG